VKVPRKLKPKKIVRKEERSLVKGHDLEKLFSLSLEKKDRSDLKINLLLTSGKANPGSGYH